MTNTPTLLEVDFAVKILADYQGRQIRLTDERLAHILERPEMASMEAAIQAGGTGMAQSVKIWFDSEADFLEVLFSDAPGFMRETENDAIMERVDMEGNILGFSVMNVSQLSKEKPLHAQLFASVRDSEC